MQIRFRALLNRVGEIIDQASPKLLGVYLFYSMALIFLLTQLNLIGGDSPATVYLPVAVLRWGTLRLDPLIGEVPVLFDLEKSPSYIKEVGGHYYSKYSPFPALLSIPLYALYMLIGPADNYIIYLTLSRMMSVVVSTTTIVVVFYLLRYLLPQRRALLLAIIYALATFTWPMATNTFSTQNTGEMFLALAAFVLVKTAASESQAKEFIRNRKLYALAGFFVSLAVISRPQTFPAALLLSLYVIHHVRKCWQAWLSFFLATVPAALFLATYNTWAFGAPWRIGYQNEALVGWSYPIWKGLPGVLISPSHGFLMYSPVMLLAFIGGGLIWRKSGRKLPIWQLGRYLSVICLLQLLLMSSWHYWNGGNAYNQRMLHEVAPLLVFLVGYAWRKYAHSRVFTLVFAITSLWGMWMNVVRAAFYDRHIFWSEVYRPEIDWSLEFSELAMYLHWYGPARMFVDAGRIAIKVGGLLLLLSFVMLRFAMVRNAKKKLQ